MNKNSFLTGFLCLIIFISCSAPKPEPSSIIQNNLKLVQDIRDVVGSGSFEKLSQFVAADAVDHEGDNGLIKGIDSIKIHMMQWHAEGKEKIDVIKEMADSNYVMSWIHSKGTFLTTADGHKTGDPFELEMMSITRIADGKAVEHWMMMPPADLMKMMGGQPAPDAAVTPAVKK